MSVGLPVLSVLILVHAEQRSDELTVGDCENKKVVCDETKKITKKTILMGALYRSR
jgi:hypothetical protein